MLKTKINSSLAYIEAIGSKATISYIIQRFVSRKKIIVLQLPGIKGKVHLRRNSKDVNVFQQIFIKKDLGFLNGKDYKVCVDAGANIGLSTIYMKSIFPYARIFSIEPENANVEMLRLNTAVYNDITIIDKALSIDSNGLFFFDPGMGSDAFQTKQKFAVNDKSIKIESISLHDIMKKYKIDEFDFVKIDIEGAEDYCIDKDALPWIGRSKVLAIEIHEHLAPGCDKKIKDLLRRDFKLSQNGEYSIFENLHLPIDSKSLL